MTDAIPERALTLWQPWAWLVAGGHKPVENRPRGFSFKSFRGDFWIHAATESAKSIGSWNQAQKLCAELLDGMRLPPANELVFGAIIGRATITGIIPPHPTRDPVQSDLEAVLRGEGWPVVPWHFPEQYGFRVERASLLAEPVPCRGYQGFWRVPADVLQKLEVSTKGAAAE